MKSQGGCGAEPGGVGERGGQIVVVGGFVAKTAFPQCLLSLLYSLPPASRCTSPFYLLKRGIMITKYLLQPLPQQSVISRTR